MYEGFQVLLANIRIVPLGVQIGMFVGAMPGLTEPVSRSAPVFNRPSSDNSFTMRGSFRQGQEEQ